MLSKLSVGQNDKLNEKCAVIGVFTQSNHAAQYTRRGLAAMQHRGQESSGISVLTKGGKIETQKGMGLVTTVLTDEVLKKLGHSKLAIGHNRYSTSGKSIAGNAHPLNLTQGKYKISIGHNGNIPDLTHIRNLIGEKNKSFNDTYLMAAFLLKSRPNFSSWEETLTSGLPQFRGAYSLIILTNDGAMYGVRDPFGIRPLSLGKLNDGWMIASESVAFDTVGGEFVRDINRGEIIKIDAQGKVLSTFFGEPQHKQNCLFEYVYFSRPDTFLNGKRVRAGREESGRLLGQRIKKKKIQADIVIPVFDSGYPSAKGVSDTMHLPLVDAITTSHYVGRTFIQPGQENRVTAVIGKHNIIADEICGKRIIVVDDSAVRLTTSKVLAQGFKNAGAKEVTMAFASPPIVNQCNMGIDMRSKKDLPAARFEKESFETIEKNIAQLIEADTVVYLPIEETTKAMGGKKEDFYWYAFGGPHPLKQKTDAFPKKKRKIQGKPKIAVFISGNGTNLQEIINNIESGDLDAQIVSVVSNKPDAYGLERAKKHNIPTFVLPYVGKLSDKTSRLRYEEKLIAHIKEVMPDLIELAGWTFILGNKFLTSMQQIEIPVINQHPALLSQNFAATVQTSRGTIPVVRGGHTILEPFEKKFLVSGFTVYQCLPGDSVDVGPIILKAEVGRKQNDTPETWEKRVRETEYLFLPTAIKRALYVMKQDIDISKGEFPW